MRRRWLWFSVIIIAAVFALIMTYLQRSYQFELLLRTALPLFNEWLLHFLRIAVQLLLIVFVVVSVVEWSRGLRCQKCKSRQLQCRHVAPFGYRYYLCGDCGNRQKRLPGGTWIDASGSTDADKFLGRVQADPWNGVDSLEVPVDFDQEGPAITGIEQALRRRRERSTTLKRSTVVENPLANSAETIENPSHSPRSFSSPSQEESI